MVSFVRLFIWVLLLFFIFFSLSFFCSVDINDVLLFGSSQKELPLIKCF